VAASPKFGLEFIGDIPWGTHLCLFYDTKEDLTDILVPFFSEGLNSNEACFWVTSEPLKQDDARKALAKAVPDLDQFIDGGQLSILPFTDWRMKDGGFDADRVLQGWLEKETEALERGFEGLRLAGNTFWIERNLWDEFTEYEAAVNDVFTEHRIIALCPYSFKRCTASDVADVMRNHTSTIIKKGERWSVVEDAAYRKQAEAALLREHEQARASSLYARTLIEASLDPLVTISADGKITDVNKATEEVTGYKRDELIGSDFSTYFTEPEEARKGYQKVFAGGFVRDYPLAIRHKSGTVIDVLYHATVYQNEAGDVQGVFAAARDITDRKRAEEQLRAASLYARSLIEASLDPLVTINPDGKITDVNKATEDVTGFSRSELIESDFCDYFTEPEKARAGYKKVFADGFVRDYPLVIRHKFGTVTDVLYNATVYRDKDGEVQGVFAAARDVTDLKRVQEELQRYSDHLEDLVEERAAAEQTARTRAHQQQMLSRIITAGNEAYSLESACAAMLDAAMELINFTGGALFLLDEAAGVTEQQYARGFNDEVLEVGRRIPLTTSFYAQVYEGTPKFFNDYSTEGTEQFRVLLPDIRILALIPLVSERRVIGHYVLASARESPFTDEEQALLIAIGQQAGSVFARLQAEAEARTQAEHSVLLNKIIQHGNTTTDTLDFLQYVVDVLIADLRYDAADVRLLRENDDIAELVAATGQPAEFKEQYRYMSVDDALIRDVYRGEPYFPSDYNQTLLAVAETAQVASIGVVPLVVRKKVIGDIGVATKTYRSFSLDEQALLVAIGQQTGTVVARLQAEQEIRVHSEHLEDLVVKRTAQLATSEEYFRTLFEASSVAQLRYDVDGRVIRINKAAEKLLGVRSVEDFKHFTILTSPNVSENGKAQIRAGQPIRYEQTNDFSAMREGGYYYTTRSDVAYLDVHLLPLLSASGTVEGYLSQIVDITERKKAEAALKDAERLAGIGETAAMIGHDLRNPLQGLQYIVDLQKLRFEKVPPEKRSAEDWHKEAELFNKISEQVYYMDKIVGDLQDFARPIDPERETVPVDKLIGDVLQSLPRSDGKVEINADLPDLTIKVEPHLMHRVFSNLILNAIQAMPDGGVISITASLADGSVAISVRDTGVGIPDEMRDKLFSPLMTGKAKGTGLGLAVVKRIVDAHSGTITFESEKGKGTTFTVTLPAPIAG
jgi:PAS domain S-box-containing protein